VYDTHAFSAVIAAFYFNHSDLYINYQVVFNSCFQTNLFICFKLGLDTQKAKHGFWYTKISQWKSMISKRKA